MKQYFFRIYFLILFLFCKSQNASSKNTLTPYINEFLQGCAFTTGGILTFGTLYALYKYISNKLITNIIDQKITHYIVKKDNKEEGTETSKNNIYDYSSNKIITGEASLTHTQNRYLSNFSSNTTELLWRNVFLDPATKADLLYYAKSVLTKNTNDSTIDFPKMLFLYGLPGTNKTSIIKGLANELNVQLLIIDPYALEENVYSKMSIDVLLDYVKDKGLIIVHIKNIEKMSKNFLISLSKYLKNGIHTKNILFTFSCNNDFIIKELYLHKNKFTKFLIINLPSHEERVSLIKYHLSLYEENINYEEVDISSIAHLLSGCKQKDIGIILDKAIEKRKTLTIIKKEKNNEFLMNENDLNEYYLEEKIKLLPQDIIETYKIIQKNDVIVNGEEPNQLNRGLINTNEFIIENPNVNFSQIIGLEHIKKELKFIVNYLKNPNIYKEASIRMPKGILFKGAPGCGKTLMARAIAGEAETTFIVINGSDFIDKYVGQGAKKVREVFEIAKIFGPTIIFIDEIDAIGGKRSANNDGGEKEYTQTLNALLTEMDGFINENNKVIVVASTNQNLDDLDPALMRRFEKKYNFTLPNYQDRLKIIEFYLKNTPISIDVSIENLAFKTESFSGADLEYLINETKIIAIERIQKNKQSLQSLEILNIDLNKAYNIMSIGYPIDNAFIKTDELYKTAIHECGHTLCMLLQEDYPRYFELVTILPHDSGNGTVLGFARHFDLEEFKSHSKEDLKKLIITSLGGYIAEEIFFGSNTIGVTSDLNSASNIAKHMVISYGMTDELLFAESNIHTHKITDIEKEAIEAILHECKQKCKDLLLKNKHILEKVAQELLLKKILYHDEVLHIIRNNE